MIIYRGYNIEKNKDSWWDIKLNGKLINVQASEEAAYDYIDAQKRKAAKNEENN